MYALYFIFLFTFFSSCESGVTEIPPASDDEVVVESVVDDSWMPSNIFEVSHRKKEIPVKTEIELHTDIPVTEPNWNADSSPIFRAIRDFIFPAGEDIFETEDRNEDPTEEIVKILEKGLIEATTMFLAPSSDEQLATTSENPRSDSISITKIENEASDSLLDRIGLNILDLSNSHVRQSLSAINTTTACSTCYNELETCIQQCFVQHNCNDVQRQARICPPPASRLCNIFTQWGPVDECKVHEDCKSPRLCCSDGCVNRCSPGVWRD